MVVHLRVSGFHDSLLIAGFHCPKPKYFVGGVYSMGLHTEEVMVEFHDFYFTIPIWVAVPILFLLGVGVARVAKLLVVALRG
jgi:hypothetical protein